LEKLHKYLTEQDLFLTTRLNRNNEIQEFCLFNDKGLVIQAFENINELRTLIEQSDQKKGGE